MRKFGNKDWNFYVCGRMLLIKNLKYSELLGGSELYVFAHDN